MSHYHIHNNKVSSLFLGILFQWDILLSKRQLNQHFTASRSYSRAHNHLFPLLHILRINLYTSAWSGSILQGRLSSTFGYLELPLLCVYLGRPLVLLGHLDLPAVLILMELNRCSQTNLNYISNTEARKQLTFCKKSCLCCSLGLSTIRVKRNITMGISTVKQVSTIVFNFSRKIFQRLALTPFGSKCGEQAVAFDSASTAHTG